MRLRSVPILLLFCIAGSLFAAEPAADADMFWPQWRGPNADGVAPHGNPPSEWSEQKNIKWKTEIPGVGKASPVIWQDIIYLLSAVPVAGSEKQQYTVFAVDRKSGQISWKKVAIEAVPHEGTHQDGTWASSSALTDGEFLFAHFGSRGLFCFDMKGVQKWSVDLGDMQTRNGFGEGSSPALYGGVVVVTWDHEGDSFIVGLDKKTGKELWRQSRDERTSWATPLIVEKAGKAQVVANGTNRIRSYDLKSGKLLWESGGMTTNAIPSPVVEGDVVYVMSGFRGAGLRAIKFPVAQGDITDSESVVWKYDKDTPYVPSPLLYEGRLYFLKGNNGILTCLNAKDGSVLYGPERLDAISGVYASPVAAAGKVYIVGRRGATLVVKSSDKFEVLAQNELDDAFDSSPAIVEDAIYLRGRSHLYCIAEK